jgi:flagellar motor switch protein FliN/FliY
MKTEMNDTSATMHPVELTPLQHHASKDPAATGLRMAALAGVKAQVTVVAGHASTTVGELLNLKEGAVLKLDAELNAPFDIVVNDTVIARGQLVAVGDHFGICVTQVQAPASK